MTPVYSFIRDDGTNIHLDSVGLRSTCLQARSQLQVINLTVNYSTFRDWLQDNIINFDRVMQLLAYPDRFDIEEPGILGVFSDRSQNPMFIDGHHRYCLRAWLQQPTMPMFVINEKAWRLFEIHGLPTITQEQLKASPLKPVERIIR